MENNDVVEETQSDQSRAADEEIVDQEIGGFRIIEDLDSKSTTVNNQQQDRKVRVFKCVNTSNDQE